MLYHHKKQRTACHVKPKNDEAAKRGPQCAHVVSAVESDAVASHVVTHGGKHEHLPDVKRPVVRHAHISSSERDDRRGKGTLSDRQAL